MVDLTTLDSADDAPNFCSSLDAFHLAHDKTKISSGPFIRSSTVDLAFDTENPSEFQPSPQAIDVASPDVQGPSKLFFSEITIDITDNDGSNEILYGSPVPNSKPFDAKDFNESLPPAPSNTDDPDIDTTDTFEQNIGDIKSRRNGRSRWNTRDDEVLRRMHATGVTWTAMALQLHRTVAACQRRWVRLEDQNHPQMPDTATGAPATPIRSIARFKGSKHWTAEQNELIISMHDAGESWEAIGTRLERTKDACSRHWRRSLEEFSKQRQANSKHMSVWKPEDQATLVEMVNSGADWDTIGAVLGRTAKACQNRYVYRNRNFPSTPSLPFTPNSLASMSNSFTSVNPSMASTFIVPSSYQVGDPLIQSVISGESNPLKGGDEMPHSQDRLSFAEIDLYTKTCDVETRCSFDTDEASDLEADDTSGFKELEDKQQLSRQAYNDTLTFSVWPKMRPYKCPRIRCKFFGWRTHLVIDHIREAHPEMRDDYPVFNPWYDCTRCLTRFEGTRTTLHDAKHGHMTTIHGILEWKCPFCLEEMSKRVLMQHIFQRHREAALDRGITETTPAGNSRRCYSCLSVFSSYGAYDQHLPVTGCTDVSFRGVTVECPGCSVAISLSDWPHHWTRCTRRSAWIDGDDLNQYKQLAQSSSDVKHIERQGVMRSLSMLHRQQHETLQTLANAKVTPLCLNGGILLTDSLRTDIRTVYAALQEPITRKYEKL